MIVFISFGQRQLFPGWSKKEETIADLDRRCRANEYKVAAPPLDRGRLQTKKMETRVKETTGDYQKYLYVKDFLLYINLCINFE